LHFYYRDVVAQLGGIPDSRFDAGMWPSSDDEELMDAVLLEAADPNRCWRSHWSTNALDDNCVWLGCELGPELATPSAELEGLRSLLNARNVLPVS
jgi:hypothetical protein